MRMTWREATFDGGIPPLPRRSPIVIVVLLPLPPIPCLAGTLVPVRKTVCAVGLVVPIYVNRYTARCCGGKGEMRMGGRTAATADAKMIPILLGDAAAVGRRG